MSSASGIVPAPECIETFNQLKLGRTGMKYMILEIKNNQIVVADTSKEKEWEPFYNRMMQEDEAGSVSPKYAVYDVEYELGDEGKRTKLCLIAFIPSTTTVKKRMTYATSYSAVKNALNISKDWQCNDEDDLTWENLLAEVK